jgi:hypothetical protein
MYANRMYFWARNLTLKKQSRVARERQRRRPAAAADAVGDPIVVLGPKGADPITPTQFAELVERSE